jgi:hypothetical protein
MIDTVAQRPGVLGEKGEWQHTERHRSYENHFGLHITSIFRSFNSSILQFLMLRIEPAHARHSSNKFGSVLAQSQPSILLQDFKVLIEAEDAASQQERLGDVVEQSGGHVVNVDYLVGYECDATRDEQHRTSVLRELKTSVFHSFKC